MDPDSVHVLSLCSGVGGLDLGIRLAVPSARTVVFVENEATAFEKLAARMDDGTLDEAAIWSDLKTFDGRAWRGVVDLVTAGYPCQPFSCAGKQRGAEDPRHLWPHVRRVIGECEPAAVFLENVSNHLKLGFHEVARDLRGLGYRIEAGLFTASEVGAPHLRKRLFVLAVAGRSRPSRARAEKIEQESGTSSPCRPSEELAYSSRHERAGSHGQDGRGRRIRETGVQLADAGDGLVPLAGRGSKGRTGPRSAGAGLAGAKRALPTSRRELHEIGRAHETARSDDRGSELANAGLGITARRGGVGRVSQSGRALGQSAGSGSRLFPPGPDDLDAWRELLRRDASLKPNFCGISHGASSRVDRLRATGNGVVPLVAAYAFASLARAHLEAG